MKFGFTRLEQQILDDAKEYFKDFVRIPKIATIVYIICCFVVGLIVALIAEDAIGFVFWGAILISPLIYIALKQKFSYPILHIYYLKKISCLLQNSNTLTQAKESTAITNINQIEKVPANKNISDTSLNDIQEFIIPHGTLKIKEREYIMNLTIKKLVIPNSVTVIEKKAFESCDNLVSVTIPNSVIFIGKEAFAWCKHLQQITFNGTITQWKMIKKERDWSIFIPAQKVICIDGITTL